MKKHSHTHTVNYGITILAKVEQSFTITDATNVVFFQKHIHLHIKIYFNFLESVTSSKTGILSQMRKKKTLCKVFLLNLIIKIQLKGKKEKQLKIKRQRLIEI